MGVVSPLGVGIESMWTRLTAGQSGLRRIPEAVVPDIEAKVGGLVPAREDDPHGFDLAAAVEVKDRKKMDRFIQFALDAARQATLQAGWNPQEEGPRLRTATIIASGIGRLHSLVEAVRTVDAKGSGRLSPFTVPSFLVNLAAGHVSIRHGFAGPLGAPATACA
jgi:3-oxoacyl-[acyl-carrier-protein] synthase II